MSVRAPGQALAPARDELADAVREHLRELLSPGEVAIRTGLDGLERMLSARRYTPATKPDHTGIRAGIYAGRRQAETAFFGRMQPTYGYVATADEVQRLDDDEPAPLTTFEPWLELDKTINGFGAVKVVLRRTVRNRTTVTLGDSWGFITGDVAPAPLTEPDERCVPPAAWPFFWRHLDPLPIAHRFGFVEAQVLGGVALGDVERVDVPADYLPPRLKPLLARRRIRVRELSEPAPPDVAVPDETALADAVLRVSERARSALHGVDHWQRVEQIGTWLTPQTPGVDPDVVRLFALFHDAMRANDADDPDHGRRGAEFARALHRRLHWLSDAQMTLLEHACCEHDQGRVSDDPTIGCCWDADRLDLVRLDIAPKPELLSTAAARAALPDDATSTRQTRVAARSSA